MRASHPWADSASWFPDCEILSGVETFTLPTGSENTWLGTFGERWFATICSSAGCPTSKPEPDVVSTDFVVHDHRHEVIRVQVKTTEKPDAVGPSFRYNLDIATYNRLRQGTSRGFLVLVVVTSPHPGWTRHFRSGALAAADVYWLCLTGMEPTQNEHSLIVSVPMANVLTPAQLLKMFPE